MAYAPEPDLFIRTGGEERITNFLLWQLAYTELYFTDTCGPISTPPRSTRRSQSYRKRERRFGRTSEQIDRAEKGVPDAEDARHHRAGAAGGPACRPCSRTLSCRLLVVAALFFARCRLGVLPAVSGAARPLIGAVFWTGGFRVVWCFRAHLSRSTPVFGALRRALDCALAPSLTTGLPALRWRCQPLLSGVYGIAQSVGCFIAIVALFQSLAALSAVGHGDRLGRRHRRLFSRARRSASASWRRRSPPARPGKARRRLASRCWCWPRCRSSIVGRVRRHLRRARLRQAGAGSALAGILVLMVAASVVGDCSNRSSSAAPA